MRDVDALCRICGKDPGEAGLPWVILNRAVFGSGHGREMAEYCNEDGECAWVLSQEGKPDDDVASGPILCFPSCLCLYLEGRMIGIDIHFGHTK